MGSGHPKYCSISAQIALIFHTLLELNSPNEEYRIFGAKNPELVQRITMN